MRRKKNVINDQFNSLVLTRIITFTTALLYDQSLMHIPFHP